MTTDPPPASDEDLLRSLQDLAHQARQGVPGCDGASVSLLRDGGPVTLAASQDWVTACDQAQYERHRGPCLEAMETGRPVTVDDYTLERRWPGVPQDLTAAGVRSSLSLPLNRPGQPVAGLNLYAAAPRAFDAASERAADALSQQAVVVLGLLQQMSTERAVHAREHEIAAALQRSLLPVLPELPGVRSAARYLVAGSDAQVGGDWYDLFALPGGAIGVAIGDVMGHNMAAAAAMGQVRTALRAYAYEGASPAVVVDRLDRLVQAFDTATLATCLYGRLIREPDAALLLFTNAGHPPALVRHPDGAVERIRRRTSVLIGAVDPDQHPRSEAGVLLPEGSTVVLYTDGLVEERGTDLDHRTDVLCAAVAALPPAATPAEICDAIVATMVGPTLRDDVALLVLTITPAPAPGPARPVRPRRRA